jgi:formylglycine-generating enzyme required for sulfatase activity
LADAWWTAAQAAAPAKKPDLAAAALSWYQAALPSLSGLNKARVEKRIAEAASVVSVRQIPRTKLTGESPTAAADSPPNPALPGVGATAPPATPGTSNAPADSIAAYARQVRNVQETWAKKLRTTVETTNSLGAKMVLIPPGEFVRGDAPKVFRVVLTKPFWMSETEVTIAEYKKYREPNSREADNFPAGGVAWEDAAAFCNWLSEQEKRRPCYRQEGNNWFPVPTGNGYRLPTEAEWEYACRAGTNTLYFFGDDRGLLEQYGWYVKNGNGDRHPVGSLNPNPFGLYDMYGNVWEWCQDYYDRKAYEQSPLNDPLGPAAGPRHVIRGGHANDDGLKCESRYRDLTTPQSFNAWNGFRIVRVW